MSELLKPDICVIGAGSGGLSVAAAAAAFGVSCVLIEKGRMGGDCLNYGCVPSKALIAAAKHAYGMRESGRFGIKSVDPEVNFGKVADHVHDVIEAIAPNDSEERFAGMGVRVIRAAASFKDKRTIAAGGYEIRARRFVIATGSSPAPPPIPGLDAVDYFTNETIFDNRRKPDPLIVIGGGPIGMEMAQAHARLGCKVSVVEMFAPLGKDDPEAAAIVLDSLRRDGVKVHAGVKVAGVAKKRNRVEVTVEDEDGRPQTLSAAAILIAAGRSPNLDGLDLARAGIRHDKQGIRVNKGLRTSNRRVYAIGDVAGGLQFTHVANYHAGLVIRNALFRQPVREDRNIIPWVTYTDPELAQIGLTEAQARDRHGDVTVMRWPFAENDRAQAERATSGFIKVMAGKGGTILGVTIAGRNAGEIIQPWSLALSKRLKLKDMTGFVAPYPTMGEVSKRAAIAYFAPRLTGGLVRRIIRFLRLFG